jgi:hypothetical protein
MLNYIESIYLERDSNHDEKKYQEEWLSWKFQWERSWTPLQRATGLLKRQISKISISKEKQ